MARKKKVKVPDKQDPPLSAMIDVVFLLLIYFVATSKPEIPEAHVALNLPSPSAPPSEDVTIPQVLDLQISETGKIRYRGQEGSIESIKQALLEAASLNPETTVMLKVAPNAKEMHLIKAMDICNEAGLANLNVMMVQ